MKLLVGFQPGGGPSRGLSRNYEIFANLRLMLYFSRAHVWCSLVSTDRPPPRPALPQAGQNMGLAIRNVCCCCVGLLIIMIIMWTAYDSAVRNYYHILAPTVHWLPDTLMMPEPCMVPTYQHRLAVCECDKGCWIAEGAMVCKKMIRYLDQAKLNPLKPCCAIEDGSPS